jgi:hypothetical protein
MRTFVFAACLALLASPGHAAVVGTLDFAGDTITAPVTFVDKFNSTLEVNDGLKFRIAPGQSGPVRLDLLSGTQNIQLVAAAIDTVSQISPTLPLSLVSGDLSQGLHKFAISALATGNSAVVYRLTLTPLPGGLVLFVSGTAALWALRRRSTF